MQEQRLEAMDEAIALIEAAATAKPAAPAHVSTPGDTAAPVQTGPSNVPVPVAKITRVIRVADLCAKSYLETEAEVEAYVCKLRDELLAAIRAGRIARVQ